jgi:hypothetical protein
MQVRKAVSGKYRGVRKEVVSDFIKELIAWMGFLNRARRYQLPRRGSLSVCFPRDLPAVVYRILINPSGLLQQCFVILALGCRDRLSSSSPLDSGRPLNSCVRWGGARTLKWSQQRLASWLVPSTFTSCFTRCEIRRARRQLVPRLKIKPIGSLGRNARISLAPEGLQEVMVAWRPGHCGLPAWQRGSAVAALVAMSAGGMCKKRLRDPGAKFCTPGSVM